MYVRLKKESADATEKFNRLGYKFRFDYMYEYDSFAFENFEKILKHLNTNLLLTLNLKFSSSNFSP